jgi:hypothetical protein
MEYNIKTNILHLNMALKTNILHLNMALILIPTLFCYSIKMPSIFYILENVLDLYHSSAEDCERQATPYSPKTLIKPRPSKMLVTQDFNNHTSFLSNRNTCMTNLASNMGCCSN